MSTDFDHRLEQLLEARENLAVRHTQGLLHLLDHRSDLRGVYALADQMGEAALWCA
jgi:hypothetical protein